MAEPVWIQSSSRVARTLLLHQHLCAHIYNRIKFPTFSGYFRFIYCFIWPKFCARALALLMVWWWCYCFCFCCYNCFYHFDILPRLNNNKTMEQPTNQPTKQTRAFSQIDEFTFWKFSENENCVEKTYYFTTIFFLHFDIDSHSKYPNIHLKIRRGARASPRTYKRIIITFSTVQPISNKITAILQNGCINHSPPPPLPPPPSAE